MFDKFVPFAQGRGIENWNEVNATALTAYAGWLDRHGWAYATQYLELTSLKQVNNWLIEQKKLPTNLRIVLPMRKPDETDTYCWRAEEVTAMVEHCRADSGLQWMADILVALACTGLARHNGRLTILLDIDELLDPAKLESVNQVACDLAQLGSYGSRSTAGQAWRSFRSGVAALRERPQFEPSKDRAQTGFPYWRD